MNAFSYLPSELLQIIVSFLDIPSKFALGCVSKAFRKISTKPSSSSKTIDTIIIKSIMYPKLFKWLVPRSEDLTTECTYRVVSAAVRNGCLEIMKYMPSHAWERYDWYEIRLLSMESISDENFDVLKWIHDKYIVYEKDLSLCDRAAEKGLLIVLQWLQKNNYPFGCSICHTAAENGQFEVLKWLIAHDCPTNEWTNVGAALSGDLEMLQWSLSNNNSYRTDICWAAANKGHLHLLKWLHDNNYPWNYESCQIASHNGHLNVLKYLLENGCEYTDHTLFLAIQRGHIEVVKYLYARGHPLEAYHCGYVIQSGQLEILKWLHEDIGCILDESMYENAGDYDYPEIVQYLKDNGCPH